LDELNADFNNGTIKSKKQVSNMKLSSSERDDATMKQVDFSLNSINIVATQSPAPGETVEISNTLHVAFK
jgi:hypothetical protein